LAQEISASGRIISAQHRKALKNPLFFHEEWRMKRCCYAKEVIEEIFARYRWTKR
jgi:hypothetical protein